MKTIVKKKSNLLEFLEEHYPDSPRTRIKKLLHNGTVRVNDRQVTLHSWNLNPGDTVEILKGAGTRSAPELPFPVLYEDQDVIVVDKPAGMPASSIDGSRSIRDIVSEVLLNKSKGKLKAHVVHRLDKEVSGILLFAKSEKAMERIKAKWNETEKHYLAFVEGVPENSSGTIKGWLREDNQQRVHVTGNISGAKYAVTHYNVIKNAGGNALLDVRTETGRKNQIRVHLSSIGYPIIGDRRYGASDEYRRRIRLHASLLSFPHPSDGRMVTVKSPMPEGFLKLRPQNEKYK